MHYMKNFVCFNATLQLFEPEGLGLKLGYIPVPPTRLKKSGKRL
jgi:hypothetical protein